MDGEWRHILSALELLVLTDKLPLRLWQKVIVTDGGCWEWQAHRCWGYPYVWYGGKTTRAHRVFYKALVGPIPDGLTLDHLCRVKHCVNPNHLEAVTVWENTLRSDCPTAVNARKTECINGHPLTYVRPDGGGRQCRTCATIHARNYRA